MKIEEIKQKVIEQINKDDGDFSQVGYSDEDIVEIVKLISESKKTFTELNFFRNNFGDDGAAALATLNVSKFNLSQCNITDKGLSLLLDNPHIKELILMDNSCITQQMQEKAMQYYPSKNLRFFPSKTAEKEKASTLELSINFNQ